MKKNLFIVSNRLPLTIEQTDSGHVCRQSSGGLVSAINDYLNHGGKAGFSGTYWAGVPGCSGQVWNEVADSSGDFEYLPVFVPDSMYEAYYAGFSNSLIWPLFHYFPSFAEYTPAKFQAYMDANQLFADALLSQLKKEDTVWIHDYHLLPLAGMLRAALPELTIGFFLHIPFPSHELFRVMPKDWQSALLRGLLGADLIGFQTVDYAGHFMNCLEAVLKIEHDGQHVQWNNRQVKVDAFPISIDFSRYHEASGQPGVEEVMRKYQELKGDRKLIFSVDRLDYTKGILPRLAGYARFLEENPEYQGKVVFALSIVPSRDAITKYVERKRLIDEYIGNLNSRMGNITWQPVIYQYNHLNFEELSALYLTCDLALITPLRDGMNLVSKEFVASRKDQKGVLVLSEMAGSAKELTDALLINPNDEAEISRMIKRGLEMEEAEQKQRMEAMQARIERYDVVAWAGDFFEELKLIKESQLEFEVKFIDNLTRIALFRQYSDASKRLFLLDYDGSLVNFSRQPEAAIPDRELLITLGRLAANPQNKVYIISGRDSKTLEAWFGNLPVGLIAEHGVKIRQADGHWELSQPYINTDWKLRVGRLMDHYVSRLPQSFVEQKEYSMAWHYRAASLTDGQIRAKEAYEGLRMHTAELPLQVLHGNKVIEVRIKGVNKGTAVKHILNNGIYEFILCIGDDKTDEDMFRKLARTPEAFTIKVGADASFAKYNLHNPAAVRSLLENLAQQALPSY